MKRIIPIFVALILVVGGGAFYGGMKYQQSKSSFGNLTRQNFQNLSDEQRQQLFQGNRGGSLQRGMGGVGANLLSGEVIAKDEQTLTLKMLDGGSKIVFFSGSTKILKTSEGSINDIEIGKEVIVSGSQNSDGSYTAQTIQERQLPLQNNNK